MNVAVVIVTFNRINLLKECINNALNQKKVDTELVVVNNKSTDGTFEYLEGLHNRRVHCIHERENIGGAGGFHDGVKYAFEQTNCDWILLIDDDAMIDEEYLFNLSTNIVPNFLAYAGVVKVGSSIDLSHRLMQSEGQVPVEAYRKDTFICDIATFCGLMISRELVKKIGYPRKDFFIWHDDTEYCYRMFRVTRILVVTNSILNHKTTINNINNCIVRDNWKWYYGFRNELVIYKSYHLTKQYYKKISKLVGKMLYFYIIAILNKTYRDDYIYNAKLRWSALIDVMKENMGKNDKY